MPSETDQHRSVHVDNVKHTVSTEPVKATTPEQVLEVLSTEDENRSYIVDESRSYVDDYIDSTEEQRVFRPRNVLRRGSDLPPPRGFQGKGGEKQKLVNFQRQGKTLFVVCIIYIGKGIRQGHLPTDKHMNMY